MGALLAAAALAGPFSGAVRATADEAQPEPLSAFPQALLAVRTASHRVVEFQVWIADNPRRSEQGLMYVRHLDAHAGMLFPFSGREPVAMWMKNTYIPLDMLFVDAHGNVTRVTARAEPLSLDLIYAPPGTRAVVELQGGICARFGIAAGDRVLSNALHTGH
ncbi:MAG: DUF192 domain-containing protein [Gammaproteobacteria bacterium]|nr:DUF192 domain-containing protein [Gammaproteobacteria bacterium]